MPLVYLYFYVYWSEESQRGMQGGPHEGRSQEWALMGHGVGQHPIGQTFVWLPRPKSTNASAFSANAHSESDTNIQSSNCVLSFLLIAIPPRPCLQPNVPSATSSSPTTQPLPQPVVVSPTHTSQPNLPSPPPPPPPHHHHQRQTSPTPPPPTPTPPPPFPSNSPSPSSPSPTPPPGPSTSTTPQCGTSSRPRRTRTSTTGIRAGRGRRTGRGGWMRC